MVFRGETFEKQLIQDGAFVKKISGLREGDQKGWWVYGHMPVFQPVFSEAAKVK